MGLWSQVLIAAFLQPTLAAPSLRHHKSNFTALAGELLRLKGVISDAEGRERAIREKLAEVSAGLSALSSLGVRFTPPWKLALGEHFAISPDGLSCCKTGGSAYDANVTGSHSLTQGVHEWSVHFAPVSSLIIGVAPATDFVRSGVVNQHYTRGWWIQVYQQSETTTGVLSLWAAAGQGDGEEGISKMGEAVPYLSPPAHNDRVIMLKLDCTQGTLTLGTNGQYHSAPSFFNLPPVPLLPVFLPLNVGLQFSIKN